MTEPASPVPKQSKEASLARLLQGSEGGAAVPATAAPPAAAAGASAAAAAAAPDPVAGAAASKSSDDKTPAAAGSPTAAGADVKAGGRPRSGSRQMSPMSASRTLAGSGAAGGGAGGGGADDDDTDPLPPVVIQPVTWWASVDTQNVLASVSFAVFLIVGSVQTIWDEMSKSEEEGGPDYAGTFGDMFAENGFGCVIVAAWQLVNSQELALRKWKWFGMYASLTMMATGIVLLLFVSRDPPPIMSLIGGLCLSQSIGPLITTLLLLEPKERETLATPYVTNFVSFMSQAVAERDGPSRVFAVVVPEPDKAALCEQINTRVRAYKEAKKFVEHTLTVSGGFKKFSTTARRIAVSRLAKPSEAKGAAKGEAKAMTQAGSGGAPAAPAGPAHIEFCFDVPSMLNNASPKKLALFIETFSALLEEHNGAGKLKNIRLVTVPALTLSAITDAIVDAQRSGPVGSGEGEGGDAEPRRCCGLCPPAAKPKTD